MKEVFGYLRVSGKSQVDGDGFDRQRDAISAFCVKRGWKVIRFFQEKGVSGTVESMERPAFSEMLGLTGGSLPTTVIVERVDRLARDLIISEMLFAECRKLGVTVYAADTEEEYVQSEADPSRKLIRQVLGAVSEFIKSELVKKLRLARERIRREKGRCEGPMAFEDKPENRDLLDVLLFLHLRGDSMRSMAKQLNAEFPRRDGQHWTSSFIHNVLTRSKRKGLTPSENTPILLNIPFDV